MSNTAESPSTQEILVSLLDFYAASSEDQANRLDAYRRVCQERGLIPHIHDPLVELGEALYVYAGNSTTSTASPTTFFVGPLPADLVSVMLELSKAVHSMLISDIKKFFGPELLGKDEWQQVRQLAKGGLALWGNSQPQRRLDLFDLMCQVAD